MSSAPLTAWLTKLSALLERLLTRNSQTPRTKWVNCQKKWHFYCCIVWLQEYEESPVYHSIWKLMYLRPSTVLASRWTRSGSLPFPIIDLQKADWDKGVQNNIYLEWLRYCFHNRSCLAGHKLKSDKNWLFWKNFEVFPKVNFSILSNKCHCTYKFFISHPFTSFHLETCSCSHWHMKFWSFSRFGQKDAFQFRVEYRTL